MILFLRRDCNCTFDGQAGTINEIHSARTVVFYISPQCFWTTEI